MARELSEGQRAYEEKRAAKAGMSLEKWLAGKEKQQAAEQKPEKPKKPPGLISRWLDRAHRPIGGAKKK